MHYWIVQSHHLGKNVGVIKPSAYLIAEYVKHWAICDIICMYTKHLQLHKWYECKID